MVVIPGLLRLPAEALLHQEAVQRSRKQLASGRHLPVSGPASQLPASTLDMLLSTCHFGFPHLESEDSFLRGLL